MCKIDKVGAVRYTTIIGIDVVLLASFDEKFRVLRIQVWALPFSVRFEKQRKGVATGLC